MRWDVLASFLSPLTVWIFTLIVENCLTGFTKAGGSVVKIPPTMQETQVWSLIPWRRKWQPTPVFFPGKSHGQRSLAGYNPWGHKRVEHDLATAVAAATLLQLCPTLCDPIDGSPPGSPVPGILQARILEWVAISFSNAWKWKVKVKSLNYTAINVFI